MPSEPQEYPWFLSKRAIYAMIGVIIPVVLTICLTAFAIRFPERVSGSDGGFGFLALIAVGGPIAASLCCLYNDPNA